MTTHWAFLSLGDEHIWGQDEEARLPGWSLEGWWFDEHPAGDVCSSTPSRLITPHTPWSVWSDPHGGADSTPSRLVRGACLAAMWDQCDHGQSGDRHSPQRSSWFRSSLSEKPFFDHLAVWQMGLKNWWFLKLTFFSLKSDFLPLRYCLNRLIS